MLEGAGLDRNGILASINKCEFDKDSLEYLGFILGKNGVSMHPSKLSTISDWPIPKSIKDLQSFLGFSNFYHNFISHYASITAPLHALTQKDSPVPFSFTNEAQKAFKFLKSAFTSTPILIHHNPSKAVFLFTDASDFAISGIPHQADEDGSLHPLCFSPGSYPQLKSTMMSTINKCLV